MKFLLCVMALFVSTVSYAATWTEVARGKNGFKVYIDMDSVSIYDKQITVWTKSTYKTAQKLKNGKLYNYTIARYIYDCASKRVKLLEETDYTNNGASVNSWSSPYQNTYLGDSYGWNNIIPDSVADIISNPKTGICQWVQNQS
ncbi:MAG: hypothetical protein Q4D05_07165 [Acinetobacter sp.]|nr:hypothetical protein [Acinetobacter sp.]